MAPVAVIAATRNPAVSLNMIISEKI
jgi:hypothetical protein